MKKVIAINCCDAEATPFIAERLRKQHIECLDIISYESYQAFERTGVHPVLFHQLPLLFILHQDDLGKACQTVANTAGSGARTSPFSAN